MNPAAFQFGIPPPWFPVLPPNPPLSSTFWETTNVRDRLRDIQETVSLAKAMQKELEMLMLIKETKGSKEDVDNCSSSTSICEFFKFLEGNKINIVYQESFSVEAATSLIMKLRRQLEPFKMITEEAIPWEEKSAAIKLANKTRKSKRNKRWRKRKRKCVAEKLAKERERFEKADQEADEWRAREIAKDIAKRKVEKMKEIAKLKANEERKRLESELELVVMVEKLQELRSIRIQKLKKQGHFLPEEDDKFLERVRVAVEEEERQAMALPDTDAAKDAIAIAELESRKITQGRNSILKPKETGSVTDDSKENQDQTTESAKEPLLARADSAEESGKQERFEGHGYDGNSDTMASLPVEFYHYYHGSNTDMGTLIEVRRTWDAYITPGGSRIPGHWVQPPPPSGEIWASYLVGANENTSGLTLK